MSFGKSTRHHQIPMDVKVGKASWMCFNTLFRIRILENLIKTELCLSYLFFPKCPWIQEIDFSIWFPWTNKTSLVPQYRTSRVVELNLMDNFMVNEIPNHISTRLTTCDWTSVFKSNSINSCWWPPMRTVDAFVWSIHCISTKFSALEKSALIN